MGLANGPFLPAVVNAYSIYKTSSFLNPTDCTEWVKKFQTRGSASGHEYLTIHISN